MTPQLQQVESKSHSHAALNRLRRVTVRCASLNQVTQPAAILPVPSALKPKGRLRFVCVLWQQRDESRGAGI